MVVIPTFSLTGITLGFHPCHYLKTTGCFINSPEMEDSRNGIAGLVILKIK